jgi:hypothetical protein
MGDPRTAIIDLLAHRDPGTTICPSEAARATGASTDDVRTAARELGERPLEVGKVAWIVAGQEHGLAHTAEGRSSAFSSSGGQPCT